MKFQVEIAIILVICLFKVEETLSDGLPVASSINKWTCSCLSANKGELGITGASNCSSSCDCHLDSSYGDEWTCVCATDGFPKVSIAGDNHSCFTSCKCSSGSSIESTPSRKPLPSKVLVLVLLLCVMIATLALTASVLCFIYRRDKFPSQQSVFSSDKENSCNSGSSLIRHRPLSKIYGDTGCVPHVLIFFRSKPRRMEGIIIKFSFSELENATNNFSDSNLVGVGGSSHVYRGHLEDGRTVAVKRIKAQGGPDAESIFLTEIELISRLHHCNLVPLLGYCSEYRGKRVELVLVYEYMFNGNLRECLDQASEKYLDWNTRVAIALGAAKGLEYLHEAAAPRILHRDVKSSNILLDEDWRAKITDLGMAKKLRSDGMYSCSSSPVRVQGTFGYFAPEYAIIGSASLKSDVFSFGVVLLELITGRKPIHKSSNKAEESLVIWARPCLQDHRRVLPELADPHLKGKFLEHDMWTMAALANECLSLDPDSRPTMSEVVQILSAISSKASIDRKLPWKVFQNSYGSVTRHELDRDTEKGKVLDSYDAQCSSTIMTSRKWSPRCSPPLDLDGSICLQRNNKEREIATDYTDRLVLLRTNAKSWHSKDDEAVDLTQPRFESFCMETVQSDS